MLKIVTIIGARPQFIKAATVSRAISKHNDSITTGDSITEILVHTGQHYDENMSGVFFEELQIPKPDYNLGIGSDTHGRQTGRMLSAIEEVLLQKKPDMVLTYGDTNSTLAGALAASKLHILSAHVEAGLRSYNRRMPEELNRIVADELSNLLFCPTDTAVQNLRKEGIGSDQNPAHPTPDLDTQLVFNVGDVMYDSILFNRELARKTSSILQKLNLLKKQAKNQRYHTGALDTHRYCLVTIHRPENTDNAKNLSAIFQALSDIASNGTMVMVPVHPRTRKCIMEAGLMNSYDLKRSLRKNGDPASKPAEKTLEFVEPVSYLDMLQLEHHATAILTDSGGVQKEAYLLRVPCITLRNETEWIETIHAGWNILTGASTEKIKEAFSLLSGWNREVPPFGFEEVTRHAFPFGDGKAAEKIVDIISKTLSPLPAS